VSAWFQNVIVAPGKLRLFCFLMAFIAGFVFIRISVRLIRARVRWWPGNVTPGGMHIHHMVFGVVFMCVGGISGLAVRSPESAWAAVTAAVFGVGTALVLDEFALALHLQDVYWSEQGRLSVRVVFVAIAVSGLALLGFSPWGLADGVGPPLTLALYLLLNLAMTLICLLKGKVWLGLLGIYVTVFGLIGAVRLARPRSPWARARYKADGRKLAKAAARESRYAARLSGVMTWLGDLVAGRPDRPHREDRDSQ
jgi:hypothetical protein